MKGLICMVKVMARRLRVPCRVRFSRSLTLLPLLLCTKLCSGQYRDRVIEPRLFAGLNVNLQAPCLVSYTTSQATVLPWVGASLDLGASFTVRDRWGFAVGGSYAAHGYLLYMDTICYDIYHLAPRAELRVWRLVPWDNLESAQLRIGIAGGYSYQGSSELRSTEEPFTVVTREEAMTRPFLAPEIGIMRESYHDRLELGLRYLVHLDPAAAWTSVSTSPIGDATYTGRDDHLALVFRYHFGFPKARPIPPLLPAIASEPRALDTLTTLHTSRATIAVDLWDNAEYDGDTISVLLNGIPVLSHHELTAKRHRVVLDLELGDNVLLVIAHNEGRVPPNTSSAFLRTGKGRSQLLIKTDEKQNAAVVIRRE